MNIKFLKLFFASFALMATITLFNSCDNTTEDPCAKVECPTNAECIDGECYCLLGYEGTDCATTTKSKYIANYTGSESCVGTQTWSLSISNSAVNDKRFLINNFGYFDTPVSSVYAEVTGLNTFTIPEQTDAGGRVIKGLADGTRDTIAPFKVKYNYRVTYADNSSEECATELTPQ